MENDMTTPQYRGAHKGVRKHLATEETTRSAFWVIELGDGQYWSITFDKTTAEYTARRYGLEPDGDGERLYEDMKGDEAWHIAKAYGVYWNR